MGALLTAIGVALLLNNLHAIAAVVLTFRWRDVARTRSLARRCEYVTLGLFWLAIAVHVVGFFLERRMDGMTQADRARVMSNAIAEALYNIAFLVVASIVPALVAFWLRRRARRLPSQG